MKIQCLLLALVLSLSSHAQNFSGGIKAGVLSAGIHGEANENLNRLLDFTKGSLRTRNHTGFFAGAFLQFPVSGSLSIEPGVYFTEKGYELTGEVPVKEIGFLSPKAGAVLKNRFIDIPVNFTYSAGNLHLFAGPQLSYLLHSTLHAKAGVLGFNLLNKRMDAKNLFSEFDASVNAGAGYQMSPRFQIYAGIEQGILKADAGRNLQAYNRAYKAGVRIGF